MSSLSQSLSEIAEKPSPSLLKEVSRALPWASSPDQILLALKKCHNDVDAAVELLMLNPDGIEEEIDCVEKEVENVKVVDEESSYHCRIKETLNSKPSSAILERHSNPQIKDSQGKVTAKLLNITIFVDKTNS